MMIFISARYEYQSRRIFDLAKKVAAFQKLRPDDCLVCPPLMYDMMIERVCSLYPLLRHDLLTVCDSVLVVSMPCAETIADVELAKKLHMPVEYASQTTAKAHQKIFEERTDEKWASPS